MTPDERKKYILKHAINIAVKEGINNVTCSILAKQAKVSHPLILHYFGCMEILRDLIHKHCINNNIPIFHKEQVRKIIKPSSHLLTRNALCKRLGGISYWKIHDMILDGMPYERLGRRVLFDINTVNEWIMKQKKNPAD